MQVASPEASATLRPTSGYPDDRNVFQRAFWLVAFFNLIIWDTFWMIMRVPLLVLISPLAVPYLLLKRLFRRRH